MTPFARTVDCVKCRRPMRVATTIARLGQEPGLWLFTCDDCGEIEHRVPAAGFGPAAGNAGEPA